MRAMTLEEFTLYMESKEPNSVSETTVFGGHKGVEFWRDKRDTTAVTNYLGCWYSSTRYFIYHNRFGNSNEET